MEIFSTVSYASFEQGEKKKFISISHYFLQKISSNFPAYGIVTGIYEVSNNNNTLDKVIKGNF